MKQTSANQIASIEEARILRALDFVKNAEQARSLINFISSVFTTANNIVVEEREALSASFLAEYESIGQKINDVLWMVIKLEYQSGVDITQILIDSAQVGLNISQDELEEKAKNERWQFGIHQKPVGEDEPIKFLPWNNIKSAYLQGNTFQEISSSHKINQDLIEKKALDEKWEEERKNIIQQVTKEATHKITQHIAGHIGSHKKMPTKKTQQLAIPLVIPKSEPRQNVLPDLPKPSKINKNNSTGYRGVSQLNGGKYRAYIWVKNIPGFEAHKNQFPLGVHATGFEAAIAYDCAAIELFKEKALLNYPDLHEVKQPK